MNPVDPATLNRIFLEARTHRSWTDWPVPDALLRDIYATAAMAPTSMNTQPLRIVFVASAEAKERLRPALAPGNVDKTMSAPVTAIFASDMQFYDMLPAAVPPAPDPRMIFGGKDALIAETAFRNSSLQAGYFMLAARAYGLDCGGMSGFTADTVNAAFFPDGRYKANFLCNFGYGSGEGIRPRAPRLTFDDVARIL